MKYYDFKFNGQNAGWCEILCEPEKIFMKAIFEVEGQEIHNEFELKISNGEVTHYRSRISDWQLAPKEKNVYPTSAYPLLINKLDNEFTYQAFEETTGKILGETVLKQESENTIIEMREGKITRRFISQNDEVVQIDWGGAVSDLKNSLEEAKHGSKYC